MGRHTEEFNKIMERANARHASMKKQKQEPIKNIKPRDNMNALQSSISKCTIKGNSVLLPEEHLDNYAEVRKALLQAGGQYKRNAFIFPSDPTPFLERIMEGENPNFKKENQFFATPQDVAQWMARELMVTPDSLAILEPSAGQGALIEAYYQEAYKGGELFYIEKNETNRTILQEKFKRHANCYHIHPDDNDFLLLSLDHKYDRIIANPPFSNNQDVDHIFKMWDHLKPGGRIVTVASTHWQFAKEKKATDFKYWIDETVEASIYPLDSGRFKSSGTMVSSCILVIDKPL